MLNWIRTSLARMAAPSRSTPSRQRTRLDMEPLEDRTTPTVSSITSNFNGTAIDAGNTLWFSSVAKVSGLGTAPATVHVTDQTISFTAAGTPYTLDVPDSTIVFNPATTSASASFVGGWQVASPSRFSGNVFLSGLSYQAASGLPGGIKNVVWSGDFTADTAGLKINWQWAAAVYTQFGSDPSALGVKASDAKTTAYQNSDHAGTPEAFESFVIGGGRGGGGSNFTGSMSATESVLPPVGNPPEGASLSGFVFVDMNGNHQMDAGEALAGVTVRLNWIDQFGNPQELCAATDIHGAYSFTGLAAGVYSLSQEQPSGYVDGADFLGTAGGIPGDDFFSEINLGAGQAGVNYNFSELLSG